MYIGTGVAALLDIPLIMICQKTIRSFEEFPLGTIVNQTTDP